MKNIFKKKFVDKNTSVAKKCDPCPKGIQCVPPIQCPAYVRMSINDRPQLCDLPAGTHGYCCTTGYNHTCKYFPQNYRYFLSIFFYTASKGTHLHHVKHNVARSIEEGEHVSSDIDRKHFRDMVEKAKSAVAEEINNEKRMKTKLSKTNPSFFHNLVFR